jgi:single-stranded DNA-binding protein
MAIFYGYIGTPLEVKQGKNGSFYTFRFAEPRGTGEHRVSEWFSVIAFLKELDADMLSQGMLVKLTGDVSAEIYKTKAGENAVGLKLKAIAVVPHEAKQRRPAENSGEGADGYSHGE